MASNPMKWNLKFITAKETKNNKNRKSRCPLHTVNKWLRICTKVCIVRELLRKNIEYCNFTVSDFVVRCIKTLWICSYDKKIHLWKGVAFCYLKQSAAYLSVSVYLIIILQKQKKLILLSLKFHVEKLGSKKECKCCLNKKVISIMTFLLC